MNITQEGFSYHTIELKKKINYEDYIRIKNAYHEINNIYPGRMYDDNKGGYKSVQFSSIGIDCIHMKRNDNKPTYFVMIINPRLLSGDYGYLGIFRFSEENVKKSVHRIDEVLKLIKANFKFEEMNITRIDLSVNLETNDRNIVDAYIRVFQKCFVPAPYKRVEYGKDKENYKEKNKNSFRTDSEGSMLTVYNKSFQMKEEDLYDENINDGVIRMRIEVALRRKLLRDVLNINGYLSNYDLLLFMGENSKNIINQYLLRFFGTGIYIPFKSAVIAINETNYENRVKQNMLLLLLKTSECKNMNEAITRLLKSGISYKQIQNILIKFDEMNINPVTLKNNNGNIMVLPSIFDFLEKA